MKYLRNAKAWANFNRNADFLNAATPKEFPCLAYTEVVDWGMERCNVHFLYADDIFKMAMRFRAEIQ